jgi:hypothetical protein
MSVHPPTAICSGNIDEPDKPRVLLTNPETDRGSVHSTDQTRKGRPIFPRYPAGMNYMLQCSRIITEHEEQNMLPTDLDILRRDFWGDGKPLEFVVRFHPAGSSIKRSLERAYIHHECTHGIIVVVPCNPAVAHMLEHHNLTEQDKEDMGRKPLDMLLVKLLVEEEQSFQRSLQGMGHGHSHHHSRQEH